MTTSRQSRRNRKSVTAAPAKSAPATTTATPAKATPLTVTPAAATGQPPSQGAYFWTHDYDYVKKDLRKLAVVSSVLFAAIIIAGFFF